jgi:hypothetical protein
MPEKFKLGRYRLSAQRQSNNNGLGLGNNSRTRRVRRILRDLSIRAVHARPVVFVGNAAA